MDFACAKTALAVKASDDMSISPALLASGNDAQFALRGPSGRLYSGDALGCLTLSNPLRARAIAFVEWPWFDRAVLMAIRELGRHNARLLQEASYLQVHYIPACLASVTAR